MFILTSAKDWIWKICELIVPEESRIKELLKLEPSVMRDLLPKSVIFSKDILVLFDYQNKIVRHIVKSIKYKNNLSLRKRMATYLYDELLETVSEVTLFYGAPPLLLPMPMSSKEKKDRGFNQCEELLLEIKRLSGNNIEISFNALKKIRETDRQTHLSRKEREKNVEFSMRALQSLVQDRVCIVLDDVFTTGATFYEAKRALHAGHAKKVLGIFLAH
jgi:ComF family protein